MTQTYRCQVVANTKDYNLRNVYSFYRVCNGHIHIAVKQIRSDAKKIEPLGSCDGKTCVAWSYLERSELSECERKALD